MSEDRLSSRRRFAAYREHFEASRKSGGPAKPSRHGIATRMPSRKRARSFPQLFLAFLTQLRGHRAMLALAITLGGLATILGLAPLYGAKLIFDNVLGGRPLSESLPAWAVGLVEGGADSPALDPRTLLMAVTVGMVALALASLTVGVWSRWQTTRITKLVQMSVRRRLFDHAIRLPLHRVYQLKSGGAASILREDAGAVGDLIFAMLYNPARAVVQLLGSLAILAVTDWRLLLGSLVILPIVYLSHKAYISRIRPMFKDIRASREAIDGQAAEAFGGIRVVRGFSRQQSEAQRFMDQNHFMARQELRAWWWNRGIEIAWAVVIPTASAALLLYGGLRILDDASAVSAGTLAASDAFTVGDLVMFLAYLGWLLHPLEMLASSATGFQNGLAGLDRVLDLMGEPRELPSRPGAVHVNAGRTQGRLTLDGVTFRYPGTPDDAEPVLQDVSLDVAPGEMTAFIGPSGAGKTTLCNLIARFYDPTSGVIALDGRDLRDITLDSYRRLLGIVEQDIFLFDGAIGDNIAYGRRGATPDQVIAAAQQANAHDFISGFPKGYDTLIGERGVKLSGGQRQRLAIARAILADPKILILDEATSNLDTESERLIQSALESLMAGRTTFVIAHRLSTIAHANRIAVIEQGRLIEQGRHHDLLQTNTRYRDMVTAQTAPPQQERA